MTTAQHEDWMRRNAMLQTRCVCLIMSMFTASVSAGVEGEFDGECDDLKAHADLLNAEL